MCVQLDEGSCSLVDRSNPLVFFFTIFKLVQEWDECFLVSKLLNIKDGETLELLTHISCSCVLGFS
jgi:hypothetical protein